MISRIGHLPFDVAGARGTVSAASTMAECCARSSPESIHRRSVVRWQLSTRSLVRQQQLDEVGTESVNLQPPVPPRSDSDSVAEPGFRTASGAAGATNALRSDHVLVSRAVIAGPTRGRQPTPVDMGVRFSAARSNGATLRQAAGAGVSRTWVRYRWSVVPDECGDCAP
jgi:hypothetical protein